MTLVCIALLAAGMAPMTRSAAHSSGATQARQASAQKQLVELRRKLEKLTQKQANTAARRDQLTASLARQTTKLAAAAKAVHDMDAQIAREQQKLQQLTQQEHTRQKKIVAQRATVASTLRSAYKLGHGSDIRLLLDSEDVACSARAHRYLAYLQQHQLEKIRQWLADLDRLHALQTSIHARRQALKTTRTKRRQQVRKLQQQRAVQQKLIDRANASYRSQGQKLVAMRQNEASLNHLLDDLQKLVDEGVHTKLSASKISDTRGHLPWPAAGAVHDYGKGVLIAAPAGSPVHAVAAGRVVYAHFLRGYGLLIIIDHGHGWMSMYGNNETLFHDVGDLVQAGTVLGHALPRTGKNSQVYFELRHHGKPINPRGWLRRH